MTNSKFFLCLVFSVMVLVACGTSPKTDVKSRTDKAVDPSKYVKGNVYKQEIRKKGVEIICDRREYLECYGFSRSQCAREVSAHNEVCMNKTEQQYPNMLVTDQQINDFSIFFLSCLTERHAATHPERNPDVTIACLNAKQK